MDKTNYIPHSLIERVGLGEDLSSSNGGSYILIWTKDGFWSTSNFTTDANGISGFFSRVKQGDMPSRLYTEPVGGAVNYTLMTIETWLEKTKSGALTSQQNTKAYWVKDYLFCVTDSAFDTAQQDATQVIIF